ncbi:hypothetical protein DFJ73DRAFT_295238 [Zopfochytrium polystomum]|nr:hypothetical protein DFJ73DRAFT_295238 [Zopfochytrium polystomum]
MQTTRGRICGKGYCVPAGGYGMPTGCLVFLIVIGRVSFFFCFCFFFFVVLTLPSSLSLGNAKRRIAEAYDGRL